MYQVFFGLGALLLAALVLGDFFKKHGMPALLGNIIAGFVIGPSAFNVLAPAEISLFAEIGAVLILFSFGLRNIPKADLFGHRKHILPLSAVMFLLPFTFAMVFLLYAGVPAGISFLLSAGVAIPSFKMDKKKAEGSAVLSAIIGLGVVALFFLFQDVVVFASSFALLLLSFLLAEKLVPVFIRISKSVNTSEAQLLSALVLVLAIGAVAGTVGIGGYVSAFLAGLIFSGLPKARVGFTDRVRTLSECVFAPLFFGWAGMVFDVRLLTVFSLFFAGFAIITKAAGEVLWAYRTKIIPRLCPQGTELVIASGIFAFSFFLPSLLNSLFASFILLVFALGVAARE